MLFESRKEIWVSPGDYQGGYTYMFVDYARALRKKAGATDAATLEKVRDFVATTYFPRVRESGRRTYLGDNQYNMTVRNVSGFGRTLYNDFVPGALQSLVSELEDSSLLHIVSDDLTIPWELVYNGQGFWGKRFAMSRAKPGLTFESETRTAVTKVVNVIGAELHRRVAEQALRLFEGLPASVEVITLEGTKLESAYEAFESMQDADIVHFTCHGHDSGEGIYLQIVSNPEPDLNLMAAAVRNASIRPGTIVFANACVSSRTQTGIRSTLDFGSAFCAEGKASAFVGTLDLVPDMPAVAFAETFYRNLFDDLSVTEALHHTRTSELRTNGRRYGLFELLYSLYGNPLAYAVIE